MGWRWRTGPGGSRESVWVHLSPERITDRLLSALNHKLFKYKQQDDGSGICYHYRRSSGSFACLLVLFHFYCIVKCVYICRTKLLNSEMVYGWSPWGHPITITFVQFCQSTYVFLSKFRFAESLLYRHVEKKKNRKNKDITSSVYVNITSIGLKRGREPIVLDTAQIFSKKQL